MIAPRRLAAIAQAAYDPAVPAFLERGDVKVTRTEEAGAVVYAWRGTRIKHIDDILRDADCFPRFRPGLGHIHHGFLSGAEALEHELLAAMARERLPVVFNGHSLAAAMALIMTAIAILAGQRPAMTVTYGCPLLGFSTLRQLLDGHPGTDYRHGSDPVTFVPEPFWHARSPMTDLGRVSIGDLLDPLHDHFIETYIAALPEAA